MKGFSQKLACLVTSFFLVFQAGCSGILTSSPKPVNQVSFHKPSQNIPSSVPQKAGKEKLLSNLYWKGEEAFLKKDYEKSIDFFLEILAVDSNYPNLQKKLVAVYEAKKKQQEEMPAPQTKEALKSPVQEYRVNLGDVLDISVWQWPDLKQPDVYVRPDGKISFPLVGDIPAVGRTLTEVDDDMTKRLMEYIKNPEVSVSIRRFGGRKVILMGEVKAPGVYAPTGESSLLEVIALAGGFQPGAVTSCVTVIRGNRAKSEIILCDLRRAFRKGDLSQNITAEANDIIYVPRRFIANFTDLASEVGGPIGTLLAYSALASNWHFHRLAGN